MQSLKLTWNRLIVEMSLKEAFEIWISEFDTDYMKYKTPDSWIDPDTLTVAF